jgi:hypothetical protein
MFAGRDSQSKRIPELAPPLHVQECRRTPGMASAQSPTQSRGFGLLFAGLAFRAAAISLAGAALLVALVSLP